MAASHKHDVSPISGAHIHDSGEVTVHNIVVGGIASTGGMGEPVVVVPSKATHQHGGALIPVSHVHGGGGLGIRAEDIPPSGFNGAGFLYNDIVFPDDANKEIRGVVEIEPVGATNFFVWEDGSFTLEGPPGIYSFVYRLYIDGIDHGTALVEIDLADIPEEITGVITLNGIESTSGFGIPTLNIDFEDIPEEITGVITLDGIESTSEFGIPTLNRFILVSFKKKVKLRSHIPSDV